MKLTMLLTTTACALALSLPAPRAASGCPSSVTATVFKAHPGASLSSCKLEEGDDEGQTHFEVTLVSTDGKDFELDVAPDGRLLATSVDLEDVPPAVLDAFRAKYPKAQVMSATAEIDAYGAVSYELAFDTHGARNEATFAADGTFLEEE